VMATVSKFFPRSVASNVFVMVGRGTSDNVYDGGLIDMPGSRTRSLLGLTRLVLESCRMEIKSRIRWEGAGK
jgi:hypothetical protein